MPSEQARKIAEPFFNLISHRIHLSDVTEDDIRDLTNDLATEIDKAGPRLTGEEWCQVKDALRTQAHEACEGGDSESCDALTKICCKIMTQQREAGQVVPG